MFKKDSYIPVYSPRQMMEQVEDSQRAKNAIAREIIKQIVIDDEHWAWVEPYCRGANIAGSKQFDHCQAVNALYAVDELGPQLEALGFLHTEVWGELQKVLRKIGFRVERGAITGLLEHRPDSNADENDTDQ